MSDIPMPLGLSIILIIFLFCIGQWQLALLNIVLLVVQVIGYFVFDIEPRELMFILAIIGIVIWLFLCFIGVCEFPQRLA